MDTIQRALLYNDQIAIAVADTTELVNQAIKKHNLSAVTAAALGRTLTAAAMLSHDLKNEDDSLTVTVKGTGPAGSIVVSADSKAQVRGYVDNPAVELPLNSAGKLDVSGAVGLPGRMSVIKSIGRGKPYIGQVELATGEIAEDFAYYFAVSEQKPSAIALGVLVDTDGSCKAAGGAFVHVLPNTPDAVVGEVACRVDKLSNISRILALHTPKQIIEEYFSGQPKYTGEIHPSYYCKCSRRSIEKVLIGLGKAEAEDILQKQGRIEIQCHFCGKKYEFFRCDINKLFF